LTFNRFRHPTLADRRHYEVPVKVSIEPVSRFPVLAIIAKLCHAIEIASDLLVDLLLHICSLHEATNRRNFVLVVLGRLNAITPVMDGGSGVLFISRFQLKA